MKNTTHYSGDSKMTTTRIVPRLETAYRLEKRTPATTAGSWRTGSAFGGAQITATWNVIRNGEVIAIIRKEAGAWVGSDPVTYGAITGFCKTRHDAFVSCQKEDALLDAFENNREGA